VSKGHPKATFAFHLSIANMESDTKRSLPCFGHSIRSLATFPRRPLAPDTMFTVAASNSMLVRPTPGAAALRASGKARQQDAHHHHRQRIATSANVAPLPAFARAAVKAGAVLTLSAAVLCCGPEAALAGGLKASNNDAYRTMMKELEADRSGGVLSSPLYFGCSLLIRSPQPHRACLHPLGLLHPLFVFAHLIDGCLRCLALALFPARPPRPRAPLLWALPIWSCG